MDYLQYIFARLILFILGLLPYNMALRLLSFAAKIILFISPKYKKIADTNLKIAFPGNDYNFRKNIINENCRFIARLILDLNRLEKIDKKWVNENFIFESEEIKQRFLSMKSNRGVLLATGHLGSFEMLAHCLCLSGKELIFIVRNFKNKYLDQWWNGKRQQAGNRIIDREGAYKKGLRALNSGKTLGILFDQNVTVNHAAFVDFFGKKAATTKILAILALRTGCEVGVITIKFQGGKYLVKFSDCDYSEYYKDDTLDFDLKVLKITQDLTSKFQDMVADNPGEWFWMHRRWKTRPEGEKEVIYK